ncbi:hypothetical protein EGW08_015686 [Elysia chlorotica]|uniref:FZ domain-containing protein n=1 Tax=Elysia chlorotica TaxID=188477 RepID=A0A3S1BWC2_ELYCH|nr:hypothetical protein EGW08_015686 [Elysia chlorotica]
MARPCTALVHLLLFCCFVRFGECLTESSHDLLLYCRDEIGIGSCAANHGDPSVSLYDTFVNMANNLSRLEDMCENQFLNLSSCIAPCLAEFRASKYSHLQAVCTLLRWIEWEEECWTEQWVIEARDCHRWLYPPDRTENPEHGFYPTPYRTYDRATIARDCFPTASDSMPPKCRYYQTWVFLKLLPQYYELHGYPEGFDHVSDYIGFPGL